MTTRVSLRLAAAVWELFHRNGTEGGGQNTHILILKMNGARAADGSVQ